MVDTNAPTGSGPDLRHLFGLFPPSDVDDVPEVEPVPADEVPPPYHGLLVHEHHMTVTVEGYYRDRVDVRILAHRQDGDLYGRKILLSLHRTGRVVQFGIMRIHLDACGAEVRDQVVAGETPLGRILIDHDVMRRIEPTAFLRVIPGRPMMEWFGLDRPLTTFGRLAVIHCNGQPAVDLLEIVAPVV